MTYMPMKQKTVPASKWPVIVVHSLVERDGADSRHGEDNLHHESAVEVVGKQDEGGG